MTRQPIFKGAGGAKGEKSRKTDFNRKKGTQYIELRGCFSQTRN